MVVITGKHATHLMGWARDSGKLSTMYSTKLHKNYLAQNVNGARAEQTPLQTESAKDIIALMSIRKAPFTARDQNEELCVGG